MMILATKAKIIGGIALASIGVATGVAYSTGVFSSKTQKISELIKKENKHIFLSFQASEDKEGWKATWEKYEKNKVWGEIKKIGTEEVPEAFKNTCKEKIKESVYGTDDPKYANITTFCSRDKIISDVLKEQNFKLLTGSEKEETWKTRFENYAKTENTIKLPNVTIASGDNKETHHNKISKGCDDAIKLTTTVANYESNLVAIKHWCKE